LRVGPKDLSSKTQINDRRRRGSERAATAISETTPHDLRVERRRIETHPLEEITVLRHLACGAALAMMLAADSWATLRHRYTFESGNANDSAPGGTAHGTLQNGAVIIAGQLALSGDLMEHVELPAATIGISAYPALTLEMWVNTAAAPANDVGEFTWAAGFGRFGDPADATDPPPPGRNNDANEGIFGHDYLMLNLTRAGNGPSRVAMTDDFFNAENGVDGAQLRGAGQRHIAVTVTSTGVDATTLSYYVNGVLQGSATGAADLADLSNAAAYLGRSVYTNDPYFAGTINEFRIHDNAFTATDVQNSFTTGPAGAAGPTLTINRATGAMTMSNLNGTPRIIEYAINSPAGALDPLAWTTVATHFDAPGNGGNGTFDNDDAWSVQMQTNAALTETMQFGSGGADDGAVLDSVTLGTGVWDKYYVEEVNASVRVRIDSVTSLVIPIDVVYTGGSPYQRSDLNFLNGVDAADWVIFRQNLAATLTPGLSDAQSYALGDIDGDQDVDFFDFRMFQTDFDAANGVGALAALAGAVPEPSSLGLVAMTCGILGATRRRVWAELST
jgi:hypothetical protein